MAPTAAAIALLAAAAAATTSPMPKTSHEIWSGFGYLQFRWGMGPGDVAEALGAGGSLKASPEQLRLSVPGRLSVYAIEDPDFDIAGYKTHAVRFFFVDDALYEIHIVPTLSGKSPAWIAWGARLRAMLKSKYGEPKEEHVVAHELLLAWQLDGDLLWIHSNERGATIEHKGPTFWSKAMSLQKQLKEERLAKDPEYQKL